ncbi:MAG: rhodanese-like domain-containing protein [Acidimicrobiia bacterium]
MAPYRTISHDEAQQLITADAATVLDVRTPGEYAQLGHIPGALLLPVDLVASAPAVLADLGAPVLVYCEHGVRSRHASDVLASAGFTQVLNLSGGLATWRGPREFGSGVVSGPSDWLLENADLLSNGGRVLDVAAGHGRHALLMAGAGFTVRAIDRDQDKIARLRDIAARLQLDIATEAVDLETVQPPNLGTAAYDVVLVFNYLHRALMPAIREAVAPGGLLIYQTFTTRQAERGRPTNPAFLLKDGELAELVAPLTILRAREGEFNGAFVSSVVARRPLPA